MKRILLVALASLVMASCIGAQKPKDSHKKTPIIGAQDSTFERGIDALPGRLMLIDLGSGGTLTVRGWNRDSVRLRAKLAGRDWRDTKVHLDRIPSGTRLRSNLGGSPDEESTSHEFELWVPARTDIELQSGGGNLDIAGVTGRITGHTQGGSIELDNVNGFADLSTQGGPIQITDSRLSGLVTTRGGAIVVKRVTGGVRATVDLTR